MRNFGFLLSLVVLISCSSKLHEAKEPAGAPFAMNVIGTTTPSPTSFYFADLQILTETSPEGECSDDQKVKEEIHQDWKANLNEKNEIHLEEGLDFKYFISNVTVEVLGFDSSKYSFTVLDGIMPKKVAPFQMRLRRTPGQVLELHFLDQVVPMKLFTTPVYTFSATEKRGACTIRHNVNVFAERIGYFKREN